MIEIITGPVLAFFVGVVIGLICLGLICSIIVVVACICGGWADERLGYK
jgi:hypothetical protein